MGFFLIYAKSIICWYLPDEKVGLRTLTSRGNCSPFNDYVLDAIQVGYKRFIALERHLIIVIEEQEMDKMQMTAKVVKLGQKIEKLCEYVKFHGGELTPLQISLITSYIHLGMEMNILPSGNEMSLLLVPLPRGNFCFQVMRGGDQAELDAMIAAVQ